MPQPAARFLLNPFCIGKIKGDGLYNVPLAILPSVLEGYLIHIANDGLLLKPGEGRAAQAFGIQVAKPHRLICGAPRVRHSDQLAARTVARMSDRYLRFSQHQPVTIETSYHQGAILDALCERRPFLATTAGRETDLFPNG